MLIVGSGNVVHNLRRIDWSRPDDGVRLGPRFDDDCREHHDSAEPAGLLDPPRHTDFAAAVPTPDHFIPLLYLAGLAASAGRAADVLVDGYAMGSLSMTAYTLGCRAIAPRPGRGAPALPDVPADETNI